jgi:hypothetical protein
MIYLINVQLYKCTFSVRFSKQNAELLSKKIVSYAAMKTYYMQLMPDESNRSSLSFVDFITVVKTSPFRRAQQLLTLKTCIAYVTRRQVKCCLKVQWDIINCVETAA